MRFVLVLLGLAALLGGGGYLLFRKKEAASSAGDIRFAEVTRGPLVVTVSAAGQILPVTQVDVGSQVSGTIQEILVDFNSRVKAEQVLARLKPDLFKAKIASNLANLHRSEAALEKLKVEVANADKQLKRTRELAEKKIVSQVDLENAQMSFDSQTVALKVSAAEIEQARTTLEQSQIDLEHATISSPIDGVVINKAMEVGQTVAANFNAPLVFQIANDLTKMQIRASVDEAEIGRIQRAKRATFTVDAFPGRTFDATLSQVRLNPTVTNNVVIYTCIFNVDNREPDGEHGPLLPGLTANLTVLVDSRDDALLVPSAALRFQPKGQAAPGAAKEAKSGGGTGSRSASRGANGSGSGGGGRSSSTPSNRATLWTRGEGGALKPVRVEIGITDGSFTEILSDELKVGDDVAVGLAQSDAGSPSGSLSPFGGNPPRMGGGGGRFGR